MRLAILLSVIAIIGCNSKSKDPSMIMQTDDSNGRIVSFFLDDTYATVDYNFKWEIKGDTMRVMDSMAAYLFRYSKPFVVLYDDTAAVYHYRPGDTLRFYSCKPQN